MDKYVCIRVYPDGEWKYTIRDEEGLKSWRDYNVEMRWGNALFINGTHVSTKDSLDGYTLFTGDGYFSEEDISKIELLLKPILERMSGFSISDMRPMSNQYGDADGDLVFRYPDDSYGGRLKWN